LGSRRSNSSSSIPANPVGASFEHKSTRGGKTYGATSNHSPSSHGVFWCWRGNPNVAVFDHPGRRPGWASGSTTIADIQRRAAAAHAIGNTQYSTDAGRQRAPAKPATHGDGAATLPSRHAGDWVEHAAGRNTTCASRLASAGEWTTINIGPDRFATHAGGDCARLSNAQCPDPAAAIQ
jgi:hypothetical protein